MKKNSNKRTFAMLAGLGLVVFIATLLVDPSMYLSITGVTCDSDGVWLKYSLADEADTLADIIPTCAENPVGGWVGEVYFYAETPAGNEYRMGGYTATEDSSQKISCGTGQGGKEAVGSTVPNEGVGLYNIEIRGTYYLESESYNIPHSFHWKEGKIVQCILPSTTCPDGTELRECSDTYIGKYCTAGAYLIDRARTCGCPEGQEPDGEECAPIPTELPVPDEQADDSDIDFSPDPFDDSDDGADLGDSGNGGDIEFYGISHKIILVIASVALLVLAVMIRNRKI